MEATDLVWPLKFSGIRHQLLCKDRHVDEKYMFLLDVSSNITIFFEIVYTVRSSDIDEKRVNSRSNGGD